MADFLSNVPGWARGTIAILFFVSGTNLAQYVGLAAPAREQVVAAVDDRSWCQDQLDKMQDRIDEKTAALLECWKECPR